jgi:3-deoxy-manno-octulosonate cytidylyltransferase (CMP-KDO synthetase)
MTKVLVVIPARLGSTRFPRKVLADRTGWPLIRHVWEQARRSRLAQRVLVATDADEVRRVVEGFGGEVVMTSPEHPNGTSRLAEAADKVGLADDDVVVNLQGDEPEMDPDLIDAAVEGLGDADASTIASPFHAGEDPREAHFVKVVLARDGTALYFSRSLIPHARSGGVPVEPLRHVGLYVYRAATLRRYVRLAPGRLEQCEVLEQLRLLENGMRVRVVIRASASVGIDTPEQYEAFVKRAGAGR